MIYCITELTIHADGTKLRHKYLFENKDFAITSLRVLADNRLEEHSRGWIRESWLDLEMMFPTFHDLHGELMIDATEEPIAFQYIDPDTFSEIGKNYQRKGF